MSDKIIYLDKYLHACGRYTKAERENKMLSFEYTDHLEKLIEEVTGEKMSRGDKKLIEELRTFIEKRGKNAEVNVSFYNSLTSTSERKSLSK